MTHGYASLAYAQAFGEGFEPVFLPQANGYALKRAIANTPHHDAMGAYPLMPIAPEAELAADFGALRALGCVSLVLVTDPFIRPAPAALAETFTISRPFKEHFLHDFAQGEGDYSKHHRYEARKARERCEIRIVSLSECLAEWCALYAHLVEHQNIRGIQAFGRGYFERLAVLPGIRMFGAFEGGELVSAHLCMEHGDVVYSHLGASSARGYALRAAYGLYDFMLRHYRQAGARLFDLGGGAGVNEASQGLTFFKRGFSNASAWCYLCGKILDEKIYAELSAGKEGGFFPAYRG